MRAKDLFEYDPRIGQAVGQAAYGIGRSAEKLKGPLQQTQLQTKTQDAVERLNQFMKKPEYQGKDFKKVFNDFLEKEKENHGIAGKMGFKYNDKLFKNPDGSFNSAQVRKVLGDFYSQFRASAGISRNVAGINIDRKDKFLPIGSVKKGSDGQAYKWQGAQWSNVKTGRMAGTKLP